jgi:predicted transcriptional regulator
MMNCLVKIKDAQSERLQKIAAETGMTRDVLLEEALELLFQQADREKARQEEQDFLRQLEAKDDGLLQVKTRPPFRKEDFTITNEVPVETPILRRF